MLDVRHDFRDASCCLCLHAVACRRAQPNPLPPQVPLKLRQGITLSPADGVWVRPIARGRGVEPVSVPPAAAA
jgi:hypothetical protein